MSDDSVPGCWRPTNDYSGHGKRFDDDSVCVISLLGLDKQSP